MAPSFRPIATPTTTTLRWAPGCLLFATPEGQDYTVNFAFRLVATEVPEPATLALIGAGLLGMAGLRRRQQGKR